MLRFISLKMCFQIVQMNARYFLTQCHISIAMYCKMLLIGRGFGGTPHIKDSNKYISLNLDQGSNELFSSTFSFIIIISFRLPNHWSRGASVPGQWNVV